MPQARGIEGFQPGKRVTAEVTGAGMYHPTPSYNPENIKALAEYDSETAHLLNPLAEAFSRAYKGLESIDDFRAKARLNEAWTDAAQILKTAELADRHQVAIAKGFDNVRTTLEKQIKHFETTLDVPIKQAADADTAVASDIRNHFKALDNEKRSLLLNNAIKNKDHVTLTAVLSSPAYLSGLPDEMLAVRKREYQEMMNPRAAKDLRAVRVGYDLLTAREGLLYSELSKAMGGVDRRKIERLRKARTVAEAAFIVSDTSNGL